MSDDMWGGGQIPPPPPRRHMLAYMQHTACRHAMPRPFSSLSSLLLLPPELCLFTCFILLERGMSPCLQVGQAHTGRHRHRQCPDPVGNWWGGQVAPPSHRTEGLGRRGLQQAGTVYMAHGGRHGGFSSFWEKEEGRQKQRGHAGGVPVPKHPWMSCLHKSMGGHVLQREEVKGAEGQLSTLQVHKKCTHPPCPGEPG